MTKNLPVIAKRMCEWTREAFFLQNEPVNEEEISEAFIRE